MTDSERLENALREDSDAAAIAAMDAAAVAIFGAGYSKKQLVDAVAGIVAALRQAERGYLCSITMLRETIERQRIVIGDNLRTVPIRSNDVLVGSACVAPGQDFTITFCGACGCSPGHAPDCPTKVHPVLRRVISWAQMTHGMTVQYCVLLECGHSLEVAESNLQNARAAFLSQTLGFFCTECSAAPAVVGS